MALRRDGPLEERRKRSDIGRYSTYELVVELLIRISKTNGMEFPSDRQLRLLRNGVINELDRRFIAKGSV